ncbi:MAG: helix-turn-helix transcriptional regulator [bacterium]|nr:helix-turn-helix transcriptional regulator [bacterium]
MPFTNSVRDRRINAGLTQDQLARQVGSDRTTIARIEAQRHTPVPDVMWRIAAALGADVTDVFTYVDEKPPIITRAARAAADAVKGLVVVAGVIFALLGGTIITVRMEGDYHVLHHQPQLAAIDYDVAAFFTNPLLYRARIGAIRAGVALRIGDSHGDLTPPPSVSQCSGWLARYGAIAEQSDPAGIYGKALHQDYADCLDRVGATNEAIAERERLVTTPSILAHSAPIDLYLLVHQATIAWEMRDPAAATRLAELAEDTHPRLFARMLRSGGAQAPVFVRELRVINRTTRERAKTTQAS